ELGSGFKIAMRDLEIRGAGNLLGENQSGHIAAVGYDLYVQMVSEAVAELKGEELRPPAEVKLDLAVDANLPPDYVAKEELRLEARSRGRAARPLRPGAGRGGRSRRGGAREGGGCAGRRAGGRRCPGHRSAGTARARDQPPQTSPTPVQGGSVQGGAGAAGAA